MPEPAQKGKTMLFLKQKYTLKLIIAFKMAYFVASPKGESRFSIFPPEKSFITLTTEN